MLGAGRMLGGGMDAPVGPSSPHTSRLSPRPGQHSLPRCAAPHLEPPTHSCRICAAPCAPARDRGPGGARGEIPHPLPHTQRGGSAVPGPVNHRAWLPRTQPQRFPHSHHYCSYCYYFQRRGGGGWQAGRSPPCTACFRVGEDSTAPSPEGTAGNFVNKEKGKISQTTPLPAPPPGGACVPCHVSCHDHGDATVPWSVSTRVPSVATRLVLGPGPLSPG